MVWLRHSPEAALCFAAAFGFCATWTNALNEREENPLNSAVLSVATAVSGFGTLFSMWIVIVRLFQTV